MDNRQRRIAYARERYGLSRAEARMRVDAAISDGTEDRLLTPAQRRRVRHKQGSGHAPPVRGPHPQAVITGEAAPFTFKAADAMRKASAPPSGMAATLERVNALLLKTAKPARARR
jgi:hypothetical protein